MSAYNMNGGSPCIFRTYRASANGMPDCAIWEVLRATMTHPSLFKGIEIGKLGLRERFVEGGLACSNPTSYLLDEAKRLFPGRQVACIISLGAGHAITINIPRSSRLQRALRIGISVARALKAAHGIATDNERVANEMSKRFSDTMRQAESDRTLDAVVNAIFNRNAVLETIDIGVFSLTQLIYLTNETISPDGRFVSLTTPIAVDVKICPLPTSIFTGRVDALRIIKYYFEKKAQMRRVFVFHGLGGAGKTQTALKAVELMAKKRVKSAVLLPGFAHCISLLPTGSRTSSS
jgi:hypothetical protein